MPAVVWHYGGHLRMHQKENPVRLKRKNADKGAWHFANYFLQDNHPAEALNSHS
ncbi:MAG: hypothetical protein FWF45_05255 [Coriobacteriia bacterium]|nr:hypothetical protein [Coriobacteriia bacterium]